MPITTLTDATVIINGVVLSDHANKVTITDTRDQKEITTFGASAKAYAKGLGDASIDIDMFQDFATGKVHQTLQPLIGSSTPVQIEVRQSSAARSTNNPAAVLATALMFNYKMLDASVGDVPATTASFANNTNAGMTYLTS